MNTVTAAVMLAAILLASLVASAVALADMSRGNGYTDILEWIQAKDGSGDSTLVYECRDGSRRSMFFKVKDIKKIRIETLARQLNSSCEERQ